MGLVFIVRFFFRVQVKLCEDSGLTVVTGLVGGL